MSRMLVIILVALAMAACQGASPPSDSISAGSDNSDAPASSENTPVGNGQAETLVIGAAVSLSGPFSESGQRQVNGYELWRDKINESGGIEVGGQQYLVDLKIYDDQSDAQLAAQLTEKLIHEDGAKFLLGPYASEITLQTSAIGERAGVITIAPAGNSDDIYSRGFKYVFSMLVPATHNQWAALDLISNLQSNTEHEVETVAIVTANASFGEAVLAGIKERLDREDPALEVVYEQTYPEGATDFTTLLQEVKAANPDVLLTGPTNDSEAIVILQQARELGLSPQVVSLGVGPAGSNLREAVGDLAEGTFGVAYWLPTVPYSDPLWGSAAEFAEVYEAEYGEVPNYYNPASAAAAGEILALAIEEADSFEADAVREAILNFDTETLWGTVAFDETGQNSGATTAVIQVRDGEAYVLNPDGSDAIVPGWK